MVRKFTMPCGLLLVEDDTLFQRALARQLRQRFRRVTLAASVGEALRHASADGRWCGFVVDQVLPDGTGLDLLLDLHRRHPGVPAVLATGERDLELARVCVARGVRYLPKPFDLSHLERFFQEIRAFVARPDGPGFHGLADQLALTPREREVLRHVLVQTRTQRQTAELLGVSVHTVKTHVRHILGKAGVGSTAELRERLRSAS